MDAKKILEVVSGIDAPAKWAPSVSGVLERNGTILLVSYVPARLLDTFTLIQGAQVAGVREIPRGSWALFASKTGILHVPVVNENQVAEYIDTLVKSFYAGTL
jgi:hypothetical protein